MCLKRLVDCKVTDKIESTLDGLMKLAVGEEIRYVAAVTSFQQAKQTITSRDRMISSAL